MTYRHNLVPRATYWHNLMVKVSIIQPTNIQPVGPAKEDFDRSLRPLLLTTPSQVPGTTTSTWECGTSTVGRGC